MMEHQRLANDRGSMAPLGIGLFLVSLSFMLTIVSAGSLFIFQKRLTNYAEMAALYVASGDVSVEDYQRTVGDEKFKALQLDQTILLDGLTVRVDACAQWNAPTRPAALLQDIRICSHASARSG